jgi:general secretion pathway protein F
MQFRLKAIGPGGAVESIDFQAPDETTARESLEGRGYTVLSVRVRRQLAFWSSAAERFPLTLFSQELRVLLAAGLPLVEAIDTLAQKERRSGFRAMLDRISASLRQGRTLSVALEEFPAAFPPLFIATVRAAEKTSDVGGALGRYVANATQLDAVRRRVVNASIYPAVLLAVGALVTIFLLAYVVPRFAHVYEERGGDLPMFSRLLIGWGKAVDAHGLLVLGALIAIVALAIYTVRRPAVRARFTELAWRIPAVHGRLQLYQLSRFYRTVGMLLRGGMPLVTALEMAGELLHPLLRTGLVTATQAIAEGHGVSQSMEANGLTTPVALRMLTVGEKSGNMGEMLENIAVFHDEELARWVDWFTRLFEPILMAIIGLVIGVIVILMYMPIFELAGGVQ